MCRRKQNLQVVVCLAVLSSSWILASSTAAAGVGSGGILPPPPPPPPPPVVASRDADGGSPLVSVSAAEKQDLDKLSTESNVEDEKPETKAQTVLQSQSPGKNAQNSWETERAAGEQSPQQRPPIPPNTNTQQTSQQWENRPVPPQYQGPNHDPLNLHQTPPSWSHQTTQPQYQQQQQQRNIMQQGQYYQQQQFQRPPQQPQRPQQFSPRQQQFQRGPPPPQQQQQTRQLTVYSRPPPNASTSAASAAAAAKSSALRIFSMAKEKVQTGMDVVSEQLDTNKMASSVSSLTSRIGSIGSSIGGVGGGNLKVGGAGARPAPGGAASVPRRMGGPPGQRMGPGPGQRPGTSTVPQGMQRRQMPPQRMGPPENRQQLKPRESYAPPMSELYSLQQDSNASMTGPSRKVDAHDDHTDEEEDDVMKHDKPEDASAMEHHEGHDDETDSDREDEKDHDMPKMQSPATPSTETHSQRPGGRPPVRLQSQGQQMRPQSSRMPQQAGIRRPPPSSMTPSWPNNGGSTTSAVSAQRRYDYDDDDYSFGSKVKSVIGSVPVPKVPKLFRGSASTYDDGAWSDDESSESSSGVKSFFQKMGSSNKNVRSASMASGSMAAGAVSTRARRMSSTKASNSANIPHPVMSFLESRGTLLSPASVRRCASIGRSQAVLDVAQLAFVVCAAREIIPSFLNSLAMNIGTDGGLKIAIVSTVLSTLDGWAPFAIVAALLISASDAAWLRPSLRAASTDAAAEVEANAAYSQLYLRLMTSLPVQKSFSSDVIGKTTKAQAFNFASMARLHSFVMLSVIYVLLSTVVVLRPAGSAVVSAVSSFVNMPVLSTRPVEWEVVWESAKSIGIDLVHSLRSLLSTELDLLRLQPLRVAVVISLLVALFTVSYLPSLENGRKNGPILADVDDDEIQDDKISLWSDMGSSSASRLGLLSSPRGVEGALEKFSPEVRAKLTRKKSKRRRDAVSYFQSFQPLLRQLLYSVSAVLILSVPLAIYLYVFAKVEVESDAGLTFSLEQITENGWTSLFDMAALLFFAHSQVGNAARDAIYATNARLGTAMTAFLRTLAGAVSEIQKLSAESSSSADFQAMLTASPVKGIAVSDLWAAHSTRKAWAVKGANVQCRNGEVVMVIGSDGSGKSRLLTAISEHIFMPPKSARSTTHVRGSINVAGLDLAKWDRVQLQRRVGVSLNDVRTVSDWASLMSGCSLEEILEPLPVSGGARMGAKERNAIGVAMKITGLGSNVLARLPSKLSTVVTASEDELKPSPLRPPSFPLSPSDWSRVLLTKVLAQVISGNDSQISPNKVAKCMIGSILLLDDATSLMGEEDEAKFITALRSTGAAVLLSSNRWASGRFADRIIVIDNGSVVESGTHNDLISLGPERSLYAKQWSAMSSL